MFRAAIWTLRQKRYATLAVAFWLLLLVCVAAGTFELHRYLDKREGNRALRANAVAASVPLTDTLVPPTGHGSAPSTLAIRYRTVTATGHYVPSGTQLVDNQSQGGKEGFYVVTPLRTPTADLLVARGFVAATSSGRAPASIAVPPAGTVRISGRLQTSSPQIDVKQAADRLGRPVFQTWLALDKGAAGTAGLSSLPRPGLSNPTGGASEWQLFSYVVQWYVFGLLAFLAPFLFARSEVRASRQRFLGIDEDEIQFDAVPAESERPALAGGRRKGELALRAQNSVARLDPAAAAHLARAQRLADRYGRPLGPDPARALAAAASAAVTRDEVVRDSTRSVYRTIDEYHAAYNDYLWQLALADGNIPQVGPRIDEPSTEPSTEPSAGPAAEPVPPPRVIEGEPAGDDESAG